MSDKRLIIDGDVLLERAYSTNPITVTENGEYTNAIAGFMSMVLDSIDEEGVLSVAAVFDNHDSHKNEINECYKNANAEKTGIYSSQRSMIEEVLAAFNIDVIKRDGYESTDIIANIIENNSDVVVLTCDKLLLAYADRAIIRMMVDGEELCTFKDFDDQMVMETYGVGAALVTEALALGGYRGLTGADGIGTGTAKTLLKEYGSIENIYNNLENIGNDRVVRILTESKEQIMEAAGLFNTKKLKEAIVLDKELDLYTNEAFLMCTRLNLSKVLKRFTGDYKALSLDYSCTIISGMEFDRAEELFNRALRAQELGLYVIDNEELSGIAIALTTKDVYFVSIEGFITSAYIFEKAKAICERGKKTYVLSLKEQLKMLNVEYNNDIYDMSIAAYLLDPMEEAYSYNDISKEYLSIDIESMDSLTGKKKTKDSLLKHSIYMCLIPLKTKDILLEALKKEGMDKLYYEMEMPLIYTLYSMERYGIKTNKDELKVISERLSTRIAELEKEIYSLAGMEFNINSPKQLGEVIFEKMGLTGGKKTKTGYSTAAGVLEKLKGEHPIVEYILEYRQYTKLKSTYADGLVTYIGEDGRIHGKFNQTITATGRISSTEPNLQNIPIRMELGREIRKAFVPEEGYTFIDADYSQIELRVLAHMSGDKILIDAYKHDKDIHRVTASEVFHIPLDQVTSLQRSNAKAVNFGIVYGISSFGLSEDLSISRKEANEYIDKYFDTYKRVKEFIDESVEQAKLNGKVRTMYGRIRPIKELTSSNYMVRQFGERVAMNSPIQGTAADIIKIAMINVDKRLKEKKMKSRLILQIHDELLIEAANDELDEVKNIMTDEMMNAANLLVPLEIDINRGLSWYDTK